MRKRTVVLLSVGGGILGFILIVASIVSCLFLSFTMLSYDSVDKDISDTYKIELRPMDRRGNERLYAPVLYKNLDVRVSNNGNYIRDLEAIDQVKIWTKNETTAYFLGENKPYIKLDLINNQELVYEDLGDYPPEDQEIFQNLASHPEWFLGSQELPYHANGGGEVPFYKVD